MSVIGQEIESKLIQALELWIAIEEEAALNYSGEGEYLNLERLEASQ